MSRKRHAAPRAGDLKGPPRRLTLFGQRQEADQRDKIRRSDDFEREHFAHKLKILGAAGGELGTG